MTTVRAPLEGILLDVELSLTEHSGSRGVKLEKTSGRGYWSDASARYRGGFTDNFGMIASTHPRLTYLLEGDSIFIPSQGDRIVESEDRNTSFFERRA